MSLEAKLDQVLRRNEELQQLVAVHPEPGSEDYTAKLKEIAELSAIVEAIEELRQGQHELAELQELKSDPDSDTDPDAEKDRKKKRKEHGRHHRIQFRINGTDRQRGPHGPGDPRRKR